MNEVEQMECHVGMLCCEKDIIVIYKEGADGRAFRKMRGIRIPPIKSQITYVIALHDIGHIIGKGRSKRRLESEGAAWQYVLDTTIVPLRKATYRRMLKYLDSYLTHNEARMAIGLRAKFTLPPPESPLWITH